MYTKSTEQYKLLKSCLEMPEGVDRFREALKEDRVLNTKITRTINQLILPEMPRIEESRLREEIANWAYIASVDVYNMHGRFDKKNLYKTVRKNMECAYKDFAELGVLMVTVGYGIAGAFMRLQIDWPLLQELAMEAAFTNSGQQLIKENWKCIEENLVMI